MGTRGFIGIRDNKQLIKGKFSGWDSYYDSLGNDAVDLYFKNLGVNIMNLSNMENDGGFLEDGLFCEYAYIYNKEKDVLEVYRGFFRWKQSFDIKKQIINRLEGNGGEYHIHLVMIIDKKKHTKESVLKAFKQYNNSDEDKDDDYPERDIIPLKLNDDYVLLV